MENIAKIRNSIYVSYALKKLIRRKEKNKINIHSFPSQKKAIFVFIFLQNTNFMGAKWKFNKPGVIYSEVLSIRFSSFHLLLPIIIYYERTAAQRNRPFFFSFLLNCSLKDENKFLTAKIWSRPLKTLVPLYAAHAAIQILCLSFFLLFWQKNSYPLHTGMSKRYKYCCMVFIFGRYEYIK